MEAKTKKGKENPTVIINQITVKPVNRSIVDVDAWRTALKSADNGKRVPLYDQYEDLMIDGVLNDAIDKRIRAVTGSDITFQYADGSEGEELIKLIDTEEFEHLLSEIMQSLFWGISVIELDFSNGMKCYSIPRKHIRPEKKLIAINQSDTDTGIPYDGNTMVIEVVNKKDKFGLILRACPYAILKRGGLGDWAQMVEIFGMPQRVGKYSIYDTAARKQLEDAFNNQGAASTIIVPKETDIETNTAAGSAGSALYKDFIAECDKQILISILSQTMTTMDGSSRSQSETHKEVEEMVNKHDLRFVQRVLNQRLIPILEARGYPVKDGSFVFPKSADPLTVDEIVSLSDIIDIPAYYVQERYGIPQAEKSDVLAKSGKSPLTPSVDTNPPTPPEPDAEADPKADPKPAKKKKEVTLSDRNLFERMLDFFADARTMRSRASLNLADSSTSFTANIDKLFEQAIKDIYKQYGVDPKGMSPVSKPLFDISNSALQKGIDTSFSAEFGKADPDFINQFKTNAAVFSAFKSHAQQNEIAAQLIDKDGNLRSYYEFKKAVLGTSIKADYNQNWLKTEYNMAVRSARVAEKWKQFEKTKHIYPNLEYIESTAAEKRPEHLDWVGTILPIEHPWWNKHTPPVDWGCECSIEATSKEVTGVPEGGEPVTPVFDNNPGKTAEFINMKEHPYVKNADTERAKMIMQFIRDLLKENEK